MSVFLNPVKRIDTVMKNTLGSTGLPNATEINQGENAVFDSRVARRCYNVKVDPGFIRINLSNRSFRGTLPTRRANALFTRATYPGWDINAISTVTKAPWKRRTDEATSAKRHQPRQQCARDIVPPCPHDVALNRLGART